MIKLTFVWVQSNIYQEWCKNHGDIFEEFLVHRGSKLVPNSDQDSDDNGNYLCSVYFNTEEEKTMFMMEYLWTMI